MTDATEAPATDEPLTDDAAIALIENDGKEPEAAPVEPAPAEEAEPEPEEAEPEEDEDEEPEAQAAVPPPPFWTAEDKVAFSTLPPAIQAAVVRNEEARNSNFGRLAQQAGEAAKQYQHEAGRVADLIAKAEAAIGAADSETIDWDRWYDEDPGAALRAERQWQAQAKHADDLKRVKQQAEQQSLAEYLRMEAAKLPTVAPELMDPVKGPERRQALANYINSQGISAEQLAQASAVELSIAWKAKQWDDAQAKAKTAAPRTTEPPRKPVKPSSGLPGSSTSRATAEVVNRFRQTRSNNDAVEAILALKL